MRLTTLAGALTLTILLAAGNGLASPDGELVGIVGELGGSAGAIAESGAGVGGSLAGEFVAVVEEVVALQQAALMVCVPDGLEAQLAALPALPAEPWTPEEDADLVAAASACANGLVAA